ncbi:MAG: hypothetical protein ACQEWM_08950 [Actinomycetota bacterium]
MQLGTRVRHANLDITGTVVNQFQASANWAYENTENGFKHWTAVSILEDETGEIRTFGPGVLKRIEEDA